MLIGVIKPLFPAVNECVTIAERGLWGWQVLLAGNELLREDQGTRSRGRTGVSLHRFSFLIRF